MRKVLVAVCFISLALAPGAYAQTNTATDVTKPTIGGVTVGSITATTAIVSWTTNEASTSYVDYGPTDVYGNTLGEGTYVTSHSVTLYGLTAGTQYHFRVRSKDAAGNEATSTDTTLTSAGTAVNTNSVANTNLNSNANVNSSANVNANTNLNKNANKNTNTTVNKNSNANKNLNANKNSNTSANANTTSELFNQNLNENTNTVIADTNTETTNVNAASTTEDAGDGRTGLVLILLGVVLLVAVVVFAWRKARQAPSIRP